MNEFSARISLRRLAQVYTDVKNARDYGFEPLQLLVREAVARNISADRANDGMYNSRLEVFEKYIGSSSGFNDSKDLVQAVLIDQFNEELKSDDTSALDAFTAYTYTVCKLNIFLNFNNDSLSDRLQTLSEIRN